MSFSVRLQKQGWSFQVVPGQTVLEAALAAGIMLPSSCRNGTCRSCICTMLQGSVAYKIEWPGLSRDERAEGFILPCVALSQEELVLEVPYASLNTSVSPD